MAYDHVVGANSKSRPNWKAPYSHLDMFDEPLVLFGYLAGATKRIELLRQLWTKSTVTFQGRWHKITDAGINPLPVQRPIPIWFGGSDERALRRLARLGDGWFPLLGPDDKCRAMIDKVRSFTKEAGRDPQAIGIEGRVPYGQGSPEEWRATMAAWQNLGASHVSFNSMKAGLKSPSAHIEALRQFARSL